jgi:site-specific DNA-methyltransferase (adenine-specific)
VAAGQQAAVGPEHGAKASVNTFGDFGPRDVFVPRLDTGTAARFFYCAKASREDRDDGCNDLPLQQGGMVSNTSGQHLTRRDGGAPGKVHNNHPTVKPTALMRWLCRLVTPGGGMVLDPFTGSGSTGRGAVAEGFSFVGIELCDGTNDRPDYVSIAERRIAAVQPGLPLGDVA